MSERLSRRRFLARSGAVGAGTLIAGVPGLARAAGSGPTAGRAGTTAATVIVNARVFTGVGRRIDDAIAIGRNGRILATGSHRAVRKLAGPSTDVIDAEGGTVMSGIHDGHMHPMYAGIGLLNPSLFDAVVTVPELRSILTGFLEDSAEQEPDGWLDVQSWNPVGLLPSGTVAHKQMLDALDTERPIILRGSDAHNTLVNSRALLLAGITASTPDPSGGEIVQDANGPTGLLKDDAQQLVWDVIPSPSWEVTLGAIDHAFALMAAGGITSVTDAWVEPWQLDALAELANAAPLRQRVRPAILVSDDLVGVPDDAVAYAKEIARSYRGIDRVRFGTVKVFMDGVIEYPAQTAALLRPYLETDGEPTDNRGDLYVDAATMGALATAFDAADWQVHAHAIGDAAVRSALDGYERARRRNGRRDNRHSIAHLQLVHPDDYPRFAELDVIPDMQLQWATRNVWTLDALEPYIGEARHRRLYPARSLLDAGARLAGGSDWPVDPLDPWNQVQTAIDRVGLYGQGGPLGRNEGIGRLASLRMHTAGTAFQMHHDHRTGTLEEGKDADLVVLDRDLTTVPIDEIKDTQVRLTLVQGEPTFDASTSAGRAVARRAERARRTAAATLAKVPHDRVGGRHAGCPCIDR